MYIEKFRKIKDISFDIGEKITLISGYNGIGKSNILSLIASGSGKKINKQLIDSNFHPEFDDYFYIDESELVEGYRAFLYYGYENEAEREGFVKRLSLKNDTQSDRPIRIIPRLHNRNRPDVTITSLEKEIKDKYEVSKDSRVPIPTKFLSLSRLYPIGETTIESNKLFPHNSFNKKKANEKYAEWYNSIIPNSININDSDVYEFQKTATKKSSTYMDLNSTTIKTQSIGQDNIGNIISALTDFYLLSLEDDYTGGILCIDEIDVSLHPNIQINTIQLLKRISEELKLQIILSTHSLVLIQELIKLQKKENKKDYSLIYLKNYSSPMVSQYTNYEALKADLYKDYTGIYPQIKIYFEDEITTEVFNLLLDSYNFILNEVKFNKQGFFENLKSTNPLTEKEKEKLTEDIINLENSNGISSKLNYIDINLGCDNLLQLNNKDKYFNSVLIVLDGDARVKPDKRPCISEHLDDDIGLRHLNTRDVKYNIIFLPNYFAPESYLYKIIYDFTKNQDKYVKFWRSLDNADTFEYTRDNVHDKLIYKNMNFSNKDIKKNSEYIIKFVKSSRIMLYYYLDYHNINELLEFIKELEYSFTIVKQKVESNRYNV